MKMNTYQNLRVNSTINSSRLGALYLPNSVLFQLPSTIEIKDNVREDIEVLDPPNIVHGDLFVCDFSNPIDLHYLKKVMKDEALILKSKVLTLIFMNLFKQFHLFQGILFSIN